MGWFGDIVVTTINLPVAENQIFYFNDNPAFFSWQGIDKDMDRKYYRKLAEGLFMSSYREPDEIVPPYKSEVSEVAQNKFEFSYRYIKRKNVNVRDVLHHIVLPEYCYVDENEILKLRNKDVTIYTHEERQCVTFVYKDDFHVLLTFTGPDVNKFNELRTEPQPIIFDVSPDKKYVFSNFPPR